MKNAIFNWSGGKDSSLTLYHILKDKEYDVQYLLTSVSSKYQRISMHGVRVGLLEQQAESLGIPLKKLEVPDMPSMDIYNDMMTRQLSEFKSEGIEYSIFGDIFLEDLKEYRDLQLAKVDMKGVYPIWKKPTKELANEFIDLGFKSFVVCINERFLDESFVGREIDHDFLKDLPENVDPCGENGEFHSYVYDGPIFKFPIEVKRGEREFRKYVPDNDHDQDHQYRQTSGENLEARFWFCDLLPSG